MLTAAARVKAQDHRWRNILNACAAADGLTNHRGLPLTFVAQAALPPDTAYETFISTTSAIPTRDNLHDFLNALVWLSFPRIKRQLNALQAAQIAIHGVGATRGAVRDAATVFDENGALLAVRDCAQGHALQQALREHAWHQALWHRRQRFWQHTRVLLFGHGLLEKLVSPYKAITAHLWTLIVPDDFFSLSPDGQRHWFDRQLSKALSSRHPETFTTNTFTPLPVLGIPGWWPGQDHGFYQDHQVFRARRRHSP